MAVVLPDITYPRRKGRERECDNTAGIFIAFQFAAFYWRVIDIFAVILIYILNLIKFNQPIFRIR
jgi:hypothetical protein